MTETIIINIGDPPDISGSPAVGGTVYTSTTITDEKKFYKIRLYGLADCQTEEDGQEGEAEPLGIRYFLEHKFT
jgi:hypothetical protein